MPVKVVTVGAATMKTATMKPTVDVATAAPAESNCNRYTKSPAAVVAGIVVGIVIRVGGVRVGTVVGVGT
jgi:hypothetical protein